MRDVKEEEIPTVYNYNDIPEHSNQTGINRRLFRGLDTLVGFTRITPDMQKSEPHSHPWEQINYIVEGTITFHVDEDVITVTKGDIFVIPPNTDHHADPPTEPCLILFCGPLREDSLTQTTYQAEFHSTD